MKDTDGSALHVCQISDRKIIHSVKVSNPTEAKVERVMSGMLMRIDTERYFIDDSEFDYLYEKEEQ